MRIVAPKVHVEVFRPTHISPRSKETGEVSGVAPSALGIPNELRYIRQTHIEDRRIKGIQFEETALFGGFIEINVAEDPQSALFDRFIPNDHVEVFYDDTNQVKETLGVLTSVGSFGDYNFQYSVPKFQGASWKSELKYTPTMVTTQLHAWDYLRLLQYINIPRGEREKERATVIEAPITQKGQDKLYAKTQKIKYQDDFLDYIDNALNAFLENHASISIFGQELLDIELQDYQGATIKKAVKFVKARTLGRGTEASREDSEDDGYKPIVTFYSAGVGKYCHNKVRTTSPFRSFQEVRGWVNSFDSTNWNENNLEPDDFTNKIEEILGKMEQYDIFQFRFLDGRFQRFIGTKGVEDYGGAVHYAADIIAISQFALIELLLKKLTIDHGLNQWFTPLVKFDSAFLKELKKLGTEAGKRVSKLVYVRLREIGSNNSESTILSFNTDTYNVAAKYATDAFKLTIGNIVKTIRGEPSSAEVDIFSEIISSTDFPQPEPPTEERYAGKYSLAPLVRDMINPGSNEGFLSGDAAYQDLMARFNVNFQESTDIDGKHSDPAFYNALVERITRYAIFTQNILALDDKMISYIKSVPASFQRADIYTGSKFNTIQYDSLAITIMVQLIASNMAGFPASNNPRTNITITKGTDPEKGRIDSYPIFAANRIVIRPRVFFGEDINPSDTQKRVYDLYPSLAQMAKEKGNKDQVNAFCFVILEVGKKRLKAEKEEPEFIFPIEDIRDFGMIKASTVNHFFNFSIADNFANFSVLSDLSEDDPDNRFYKNITSNGIFLEYREGDLSSVGFSPPEHQHLKLEDLTQSGDYNSWKNRASANPNIRSERTGQPIFNPRTAYINRQVDANADVEAEHYIINNYDDWNDPIEIVRVPLDDTNRTSIFYLADPTTGDPTDIQLDFTNTTILPFNGITSYVDITDLKSEYRALELILTSKDIQYVDISNLEQELMNNIWVRAPLDFKIDLEADRYDDIITFIQPGETEGARQRRVSQDERLSKLIVNYNEQLDKIERREMMWFFPISGHDVLPDGRLSAPTLEEGVGFSSSDAWKKHLLLVTYLDLLVKGIRYLLWSIAKARFICHVYLPIDYDKYAKRTPDNKSLGFDLKAGVVEPGSSVQITYDPNNTLFKSVGGPLIPFPITGLEKGQHLPLVNSISRGTDIIKDEDGKFTKEVSTQEMRDMTWYVSKKVTYLGADGAMMRVEMTEGSLDWTLFYNEKNLLTQVSEHYMLNGLGNFRSGRGLI